MFLYSIRSFIKTDGNGAVLVIVMSRSSIRSSIRWLYSYNHYQYQHDYLIHGINQFSIHFSARKKLVVYKKYITISSFKEGQPD